MYNGEGESCLRIGDFPPRPPAVLCEQGVGVSVLLWVSPDLLPRPEKEGGVGGEFLRMGGFLMHRCS